MNEETFEQDSEELDETNLSEKDAHSDEGEEGTSQTFKVGDKEYTTEQIESLEKRSKDYDALLPDYTRKSQELAGLKGHRASDEHKSPFEDPNYKPTDYNQYYKDIRSEILREEQLKQQQIQQQQQELSQKVNDFMETKKRESKDFDQKDFSDYTLRHFKEINTLEQLETAYSAYKELSDARAQGQKEGREGKELRKDNVSQPGGSQGDKTNFSDIRSEGGSILDNAMEAFRRLK